MAQHHNRVQLFFFLPSFSPLWCPEERDERKRKYLTFGHIELFQRPHKHLAESILQLGVLVLQLVDEDSSMEGVLTSVSEGGLLSTTRARG